MDVINTVYFILSLVLLYFVIEFAVRKGINNSIIGEYFKEKSGDMGEKKPLIEILEDELNKDKK